MDVVIQEITPGRSHGHASAAGPHRDGDYPIADIAKIKKTSAKKMSKTSKVLIGTAVALGVLVIAAVAACATSYSERSGISEATH